MKRDYEPIELQQGDGRAKEEAPTEVEARANCPSIARHDDNHESATARAPALVPDLAEARRLFLMGFKLCKLLPMMKRPEGDDWNNHPVSEFDEHSTGYGIMLASNGLCSVDPDNADLARTLLAGFGFDLEEILNAGVRTVSTRPSSGGRSTFLTAGGLSWIKFSFEGVGTVLELRAKSPNLQDVVPGLAYKDRTGAVRTQRYAGEKKFDDAGPLPVALLNWWKRMSEDLDFRREQQTLAGQLLGLIAHPSVSNGKELAFKSPWRAEFNSIRTVPSILLRHGYKQHGSRFAAPNSEGAPGIRLIRGKRDLYQSDHGSDRLHGTFDPWTAFVVLDHQGDLTAAERAAEMMVHREILDEFDDEVAKADRLRLDLIDYIEVQTLVSDAKTLADEVIKRAKDAHLQDAVVIELVEHVAAITAKDVDGLKKEVDLPRPVFEPYVYDVTRLRPVEFVVDGFIRNGLTVIAGAPGVGKTSLLVPLAATVAHLFESELSPVLRRKVVYFSEAPEQVETVLYGLAKRAPGAKPREFCEWFKLVPSRRIPAERLAKVIGKAVKDNTVTFNGYAVAPLVVLDTSNANVDLENENDNAEVGRAIAAIKENLGDGGCWLVHHTAKALKRADVTELTARGAGAFAGDANATAFVFSEEDIKDKRFMWVDKHRFEATFRELEFLTETDSEIVETPWGMPQRVTYRVGIPSASDTARRIAERDKAKEQREQAQALERAVEIGNQIRTFIADRGPSSRNQIEKGIRRKAEDLRAAITAMLGSGELVVTGIGPGGGELLGIGGAALV